MKPPATIIKDAVTLFPTMELPLYVRGAALSRQQFDLARDGREYVMVYYGIIFYTDAFGTNRWTRYCWMYRGQSMTEKDADGCLGHNDSN